MKIYSNRVDDTYTSSHRILESLSRNGTSGNAEDGEGGDDDNEEGGEQEEGAATASRKAKKASTHRVNTAQTIERNVAALNAVKLENDYAVDPMFHKISKAFDEGGAKGMLMNNLRTSSHGCALSFHFTPTSTNDSTPSGAGAVDCNSAFSSTIDIGDLLTRAGINSEDLAALRVCPALDMYRDQIGLSVNDAEVLSSGVQGALDAAAVAFASTAAHYSPVTAAGRDDTNHMDTTGATTDGAWEDSNNDNDGGGYDDADDDYEPQSARSAAVSPEKASTPVAASTVIVSSSPSASEDAFTKLRWDSAESSSNGRRSSSGGASTTGTAAAMVHAADMEVLVQGLECITLGAGPAEYSYFDTNAIFSSSNAWAGARHWKYATRKRTAATANASNASAAASETAAAGDVDEDGNAMTSGKAAKKTTKKGGKKADGKRGEAGLIDFSLDLVDVSQFDLPKASKSGSTTKADATQLTAAALSKLAAGASALFLPPDAKVQVKDLCRLYLAPQVMIPANSQQRAALAQSATAAKQRSGSSKVDKFLSGQGGSERVWGLSAPAALTTTASSRVRATAAGSAAAGGAAGASGEYASNGSYGDDNDGDDCYGGDYGGGADDDDDDNDYTANRENNPAGANLLPPALAGLGINQSQLLQAERTVEKIEIG